MLAATPPAIAALAPSLGSLLATLVLLVRGERTQRPDVTVHVLAVTWHRATAGPPVKPERQVPRHVVRPAHELGQRTPVVAAGCLGQAGLGGGDGFGDGDGLGGEHARS